MTKFYSVFGTNCQQYLWLQLLLHFTMLKTMSLNIKQYVKNKLSDTILNNVPKLDV